MNPSKRSFLKRGAALIAVAVGLSGRRITNAAAEEPLEIPPWMKSPGAGFNEYGVPSRYEKPVTRTLIRSQPGTTGSGAARTPLEALEGTITPSGLHFERSHSGVPDIDPARHRLLRRAHGFLEPPKDDGGLAFERRTARALAFGQQRSERTDQTFGWQ